MLAEQYFGDSEENERPFGKDVVEQTQDILELLKEPTMVDVIYKAKAASEYHSIVPHSLKERAKTVHALDALWGAWKNEIMTARGTVKYQLIDGLYLMGLMLTLLLRVKKRFPRLCLTCSFQQTQFRVKPDNRLRGIYRRTVVLMSLSWTQKRRAPSVLLTGFP